MKVSKKLKSIQERIDNLERNGYTVHLHHYRQHDNGETEMVVQSPHDVVFTGIAKCSKSDMFDKVTGTAVAFKHLMQNLAMYADRAERKRLLEGRG